MNKKDCCLESDEREGSRCTITCAESGCTEHIHYDKCDIEVHLYCWKHRSVDGRHSAVRTLR